ncbi:MAG TPA: TetR/AcrR family transcriptional regulator [Nevskiaceae bacterium]|nr:TetR/AcrR family transcriptional regulator [Nevskiaceae bacterium]
MLTPRAILAERHDEEMDAKSHPPKLLVPATARGEATRRKLLAAAEEEFGHKGFHSASVSSITLRAGVGQGTFYLYFHSKEEIFVTLVREIGHALRKHMADAVRGATDRLHSERLGLDAFLEFASAHPGLYRIVQESQFVDETVFREYYERLAQGYSKALEAAAADGQISPGDAETRAWAIMGIGHFLGQRYCLWQGQRPEPAVMDEVMRFISQGMAPR